MCSHNEHENWDLISLNLSGEADEPALKELDELIKTDQALAYRFQLLQWWWNACAVQDAQAFDLFFENLLNRLSAGK